MKKTIHLSESKLNNMIREAIADLSWQEHADMADKHQKKGDEQSSMFSKNGGPSSTWEREQAKDDYDKATEHRKASIAKWKKETGGKDKKAYEDSLNALKDKEFAEAVVHAVTENVMRVINENYDPFATQDRMEKRIIDSYDEGLFKGLGLEAYFDWKKNGGSIPKMTTKQAHQACDAVSDMEDKLWRHNQGDSELSDQLGYIENELGNLIVNGVFQTNDIAESVIRKINESNEGYNDDEPYLWCEICYYDEGSETAYELDELIDNEDNIDCEYYDYTDGEVPDDLYNCLVAHTDGNYKGGDNHYQLCSDSTGNYTLYRKMYLGEIKSWLDHDGGLPINATEDVKEFVRQYCPEYLEN